MLRGVLAWADAEIADFASISASAPGEAVDDLGQDTAQRFADAIGTASALIKPPGFEGEWEVRAVRTAAHSNNHVSFRANRFGVVRYLRLATGDRRITALPDVRDDDSGRPRRTLPITSIRVGPTPCFDRAVPGVEALCPRAGLTPANTPIRESKVPVLR